MPQFDAGNISIAYDDITPERSHGTVLLVHGFATNRRENWQRLGWYGAFERKGYRVIALDCRGHGESGKPVDPSLYSRDAMAGDIVAVMDHLGIPTADLMGYSMGARLALTAAIAHPDRFSHVVLGGIGGRLFEPPRGENTMAAAMEADNPDDISDPLLRSFRHFADEQGEDRRALAALSRASFRIDDVAPACTRVKAPVLVVAGARDVLAGDPQVLAKAFPTGISVVLPGCDHFSAIPHGLFKASVFDFLDDELV
ncbi:MAG: alpha/beta hydrolase [Rhizomicrobium sp.]|jgi:pimeloyl-ACP methyl ester carboxylesterase